MPIHAFDREEKWWKTTFKNSLLFDILCLGGDQGFETVPPAHNVARTYEIVNYMQALQKLRRNFSEMILEWNVL